MTTPPPVEPPRKSPVTVIVLFVVGVVVLFCFGCLGTCLYGEFMRPAATPRPAP